MTAKDFEERILVLAPTGRDAPLIGQVLSRAGMEVHTCADVAEVCAEWRKGAGAAFLAEEALNAAGLSCLVEASGDQPPWSDLPIVVMTGGGKTTQYSTRISRVLQAKGNVTLLERPLRILTLVSAINAALRARRRQYEVRDLLTEAQEGVRQRDQFLAMLGHELRNPLGAIRTSIHLLNLVRSGNESLAAQHREIITRQADHLTRLLDDLLDVARITSGKVVLNRQVVDLRAVAGRSLQALQPEAKDHRHTIAFHPADEPVPVEGDPVRLEQVVTNLLTNAVKYTPEEGEITVTVGREAGQAVVRVRDSGVGIPRELLTRLFEPFAQAEQSLDRSRGGLGIGLAVVRGLVEMHGGLVKAASPGPGQGSEFSVYLPLTSAAPAPAKPGPAVSRNGPSRHILLIEDGPDARASLSSLLQLLGHRVEVAADGPSGVETALRSRPEIAFVDIGLPGIDGYEVARRIRGALRDRICLVALTGYGQPDDRERALQAGFDRHLVKPLDPEQLHDLLADGAVRSQP